MLQGYWRNYPALTTEGISLDGCEWRYCINPTAAPNGTRLTNLQYNGNQFNYQTSEVEFGDKVKYYCFNGMKAEDDFSFEYTEATCSSGNTWTDPPLWKTCTESKFKIFVCLNELIMNPNLHAKEDISYFDHHMI